MGKQAEEQLTITFDELPAYLMANHSVFMEVEEGTYYLTDCNDNYWRAQDTTKLNEKGHFVDCSDLVATTGEFIGLPFIGADSIKTAFDRAKFYASVK